MDYFWFYLFPFLRKKFVCIRVCFVFLHSAISVWAAQKLQENSLRRNRFFKNLYTASGEKKKNSLEKRFKIWRILLKLSLVNGILRKSESTKIFQGGRILHVLTIMKLKAQYLLLVSRVRQKCTLWVYGTVLNRYSNLNRNLTQFILNSEPWSQDKSHLEKQKIRLFQTVAKWKCSETD